MEEPLYSGQKLKKIFWLEGEALITGIRGTKSITVFMEYGQMSCVPWVEIVNALGEKFRYNVAMLSGYELEENV